MCTTKDHACSMSHIVENYIANQTLDKHMVARAYYCRGVEHDA